MFGYDHQGLYKFNIQRAMMRISNENYRRTGLFYGEVCGQDRRLLYYYNKGPPKGFLIMVSLFTTHAVIDFSIVTLFP